MFSAGTYFAFPVAVFRSTEVVFKGVGIRSVTVVALSLELKLALMVTTYETSLVPFSVMVGRTRRGKLIFAVERYLKIVN